MDAGCLLEASRTVCVWTLLTYCWHVFLVFFFFFVGELLQVVFGADVSERLVMGSVREVSGLGGGPGAAVAVSLTEGGWPRTGAVARGRTGPWAGAPLGASGSSGRSPSSASVVVQGRAVWAPGSRQEWTVGQPE